MIIGKFKSIDMVSKEIESEIKKQKIEMEWYKHRIQQLALRKTVKAN